MTISPEVHRRFRVAAASQDLLDVAYDLIDTPVGSLLIAGSRRGLCRIEFDPEPNPDLEGLARAFGAKVLRAPGHLDPVKQQLEEYFRGERSEFDLPVDLTPLQGFGRRVLTELARVPYGTVITYGALARQAERPKAARAVGTVMNRNPVPIVLPCHRVIGSTGKLVGYGGGIERKEALLRLEGALA